MDRRQSYRIIRLFTVGVPPSYDQTSPTLTPEAPRMRHCLRPTQQTPDLPATADADHLATILVDSRAKPTGRT